MALPTKEKTWLHTVNQTVGANVGGTPDNRDYLFKLKQSLIGFAATPWTVWGSSNGTSYDSGGGTDYWSLTTWLNWANPGSAHSWIVLKQAGVGANYSICMDLSKAGAPHQFVLVLSPVAGFTGGSLTARPTATDEIVLKDGDHGGVNGAWTGKLHVMQSNDGECTRWILNRSSNVYAFGMFDKPKAPLAAWTAPNITGYTSVSTLVSNLCIFGVWNDVANVYGRISTTFNMFMTCEGWITGSGGENLTLADEDSGDWPIMPIALSSVTAAHRGARKGQVYDLWWTSTALNTGDTFPDDASKQFVVFDDLTLPWNGTTPQVA